VGCIVNSNRIIVNTTAVVNSGVASTNGIHWSSNEISSTSAQSINFSGGLATSISKSNSGDVRVVRAFQQLTINSN
jgi:hypothetical protein